MKNLQGDIVGILDNAGNWVVEYTYDAWGAPTSLTGSMASTLGVVNPFRYRGYVYDQETGLYYLRSRYYHPGNGRFLNADVFVDCTTLLRPALYVYCRNNSIKYKDPDGTSSILAILLLGGVLSCAPSVAYAPSTDNDAKKRHYSRNDYNMEFPDVYDPTFFEGWDQNVSAACHQFSAPNKDNFKVVSPDGKMEVIYDVNWNEVTDVRDVGTYNYASPNEDPLGHFWEDVYPWILWGNSPSDTTTVDERISAFVFETGEWQEFCRDAIYLLMEITGEPR